MLLPARWICGRTGNSKSPMCQSQGAMARRLVRRLNVSTSASSVRSEFRPASTVSMTPWISACGVTLASIGLHQPSDKERSPRRT